MKLYQVEYRAVINVEADDLLTAELDASAFSDATREAEEQADKKLREADRSTEKRTQPAESLPQNY